MKKIRHDSCNLSSEGVHTPGRDKNQPEFSKKKIEENSDNSDYFADAKKHEQIEDITDSCSEDFFDEF